MRIPSLCPQSSGFQSLNSSDLNKTYVQVHSYNTSLQILPNPNDIKIFFNCCIFKPLIFLWWGPQNHWRPWGVEGCQRQLWPGNICQLDYEIYFWFSILFFFFFLPLPVLLADPVFWLTGICKCPVSPTADLDCAGVSFPETERANATGSSNLIYQEACLFTNCTHQLGFLLNFEGPVLLLFTPTQL